MIRNMRTIWILLALMVTALVVATEDPADLGAHLPSQSAADAMREHAGTDGAFLAAGLVKESFVRENLASLLQFPSDELVVVTLTGAQIRQAFERSLSLLPQSNTSFLQISGFEVTYSRSAPPNQRILTVLADGSKLDEARSYTVAMPSSLARGGLGYFKIWDRSKITKTIEGATLEDVLRGKRLTATSPRWQPQ
jgi:2',3'-cyclic-nucleotide 2'-phosphodiesterase (5'-nucleotidase family)